MFLKTLAMLTEFGEILIDGDLSNPEVIKSLQTLSSRFSNELTDEQRKEFVEHIKKYLIDKKHMVELTKIFFELQLKSEPNQQSKILLEFKKLLNDTKQFDGANIETAKQAFHKFIGELNKIESEKLSQAFIAVETGSGKYKSDFTDGLIKIINEGVDTYQQNSKQFGLRDSFATFFKGVEGGQMFQLFAKELVKVPQVLFDHFNATSDKLDQLAQCARNCNILLHCLEKIKLDIAHGSERAQEREKSITEACNKAIQYIQDQKIIFENTVNVISAENGIEAPEVAASQSVTVGNFLTEMVTTKPQFKDQDLDLDHLAKFKGSAGGSIDPALLGAIPKISNINSNNNNNRVDNVVPSASKQQSMLVMPANIATDAVKLRGSLKTTSVTPEKNNVSSVVGEELASVLKKRQSVMQPQAITEANVDESQEATVHEAVVSRPVSQAPTKALPSLPSGAAQMTLAGVIQPQVIVKTEPETPAPDSNEKTPATPTPGK